MFQAVPDSLLINGVGSFYCAMAPPARPVDCIEKPPSTPILDLDLDAIYRIRVVNTGYVLSNLFSHFAFKAKFEIQVLWQGSPFPSHMKK